MPDESHETESRQIAECIHVVRGRLVMLDEDLAHLYGTETRILNQSVRRNRHRFPEDFMLDLTLEEWKSLKSQSVTSSWGGRRKPGLAFTEHGVAMLASVLNTEEAVAISIRIIRAFNQIKELGGAAEGIRASMGEIIEAQKVLHEDFFRALAKLRDELRSEGGQDG